MPELSLEGAKATYEVVFCSRKTLGVVVSPNGQVVVRVPLHTSRARIADFTERFKPWIFKQLERYRQTCSPYSFITGESLPYLGKKYTLKVIADDAEALPVIIGSRIRVWVARGLGEEGQREAVRKALTRWYERQAQQVLPTRLEILAARLGVHPAAVKVKRQVRRWGSCTVRGLINLNWQLVMAPPEVIDYVIVHELCHLKIHGHQREFWEGVARYVPDYKKSRKWLRVNGRALSFLSD